MNEYGQFSAEDDDILASVLEESLRHYNEVEVPLRSVRADIEQEQSNVEKAVSSPIEIVDLCESPKKTSVVQSRLSHFFKKPSIVGTISKQKINNEIEIEQQPNQNSSDINSSPSQNYVGSLSEIYYKEPDAEGFHLSSGIHYVYPSNLPVREYQMDIVRTALFHNTLVSLPTGTGKTFIAAVIMYNFYRWYPMGKIIFMAPTRPLVAQQIEACHSIMGIPKEVTFEMTGNIPPEQRYLAWKKYRVFFLTPQVLANDLSNNKCSSETFRCIIVDEAHRATKDYAYAQVLRHLHEENRLFRIVGLSATPGTTVESVVEVIQNLNISKLEFRTDESPDVSKYMNKKDVECITVKLSNAMLHVRSKFLIVYDKYSRKLKQYHALTGNITNMAKFQIYSAKQKFMSGNLARELPKHIVGSLINDFTICMSLAHALELLNIYGIKAFYIQILDYLENHKCLSNDSDLQKIMHDLNREISSQDLTWSHPKLLELKKIVLDYFHDGNSESNSKIIIFCQYRVVVVEIFELLQTFGSHVKPVMFVGQSLREKGGLPQKKQLEVMSLFKSGVFNVLIATSVAEEGLDIGEVDLIICLESSKSPIKFVQRLGRTGRKRSGKCITLLTEGKEQMKYKSSVSTSKTLVSKMAKNKAILSKLAPGGPRLIPKHINPKRLMIHVKISEEVVPEKKKKAKRKNNGNIMQYTTSNNFQNETIEELGSDIFQNNSEKPAKKSKKRKINESAVGRAVSPQVEESWTPSERHETGIEAFTVVKTNGFADEEAIFDEWLLSCERAEAVVTDEHFYKLLSLFSDLCATSNSDDVREEHAENPADFDRPSESQSEYRDHKDDLPTVVVCNKIKNDSDEDLFEDRYKSEQPQFGNFRTDAEEKREFGCSVGPRSPAIRSCNYQTENGLESDEDDGLLAMVDFDIGIKDQVATHQDKAVNRFADAEDDSSLDSVKFVEPDECAEQEAVSEADCEDETAAELLNFEDMFKSQRADRFIERYNSEITLRGCERTDINNDDDDNSESDSPEFFSCKMPQKKCSETKPVEPGPTATPAERENRSTPAERENRSPPSERENNTPPRPLLDDDDDDADLMDIDIDCFDSDKNEVFTQKQRIYETFAREQPNDAGGESFVREEPYDVGGETFAREDPNGETRGGLMAAAAEKDVVRPWPSSSASSPYGGRGLQRPLDTLRACNLLKPGFSLKMSGPRTAFDRCGARADEDDAVSPVRRPRTAVWPPALKFSQSTPKAPSWSSDARTLRTPKPAVSDAKTSGLRSLLTSSSDSDSDSDVFVGAAKSVESGPRRAKNKRRTKRKKKFVFIDDEADVSNYCGDTSGPAAAAVRSCSSSDEDDNDVDGELDSSFIDDDDDHDKSEPSTSMTRQYLQSVKDQTNVRGVFKIPHLSTQHYNIDVYSQAVDKNDNSYEEDSFCVRDVSDANTSSSAQQTSEERPTKSKKRKRIMSPKNSSDSDSPVMFGRTEDRMQRKRSKARTSLDFSR